MEFVARLTVLKYEDGLGGSGAAIVRKVDSVGTNKILERAKIEKKVAGVLVQKD